LSHFQLASLYAEHGDIKHALREYEIVARLMPEMKEAHYRLAGLYKQTGQKEKAANEMELFTQARDRQTASTISVEQFISVIDPPRPQGVPDHSCLQSAP